MRPEEGTSIDMSSLKKLLAPKDVVAISFERKDNFHGIGYSGLDPYSAMYGNASKSNQQPQTSFKPTGREKKGIRGQVSLMIWFLILVEIYIYINNFYIVFSKISSIFFNLCYCYCSSKTFRPTNIKILVIVEAALLTTFNGRILLQKEILKFIPTKSQNNDNIIVYCFFHGRKIYREYFV